MRFSMLYSGEQILSFKSCFVFYAGDSLNIIFDTFSMFFDFYFSIFFFSRDFLSIKSPIYILSYSLYCRLDISSFRCVDV